MTVNRACKATNCTHKITDQVIISCPQEYDIWLKITQYRSPPIQHMKMQHTNRGAFLQIPADALPISVHFTQK